MKIAVIDDYEVAFRTVVAFAAAAPVNLLNSGVCSARRPNEGESI